VAAREGKSKGLEGKLVCAARLARSCAEAAAASSSMAAALAVLLKVPVPDTVPAIL